MCHKFVPWFHPKKNKKLSSRQFNFTYLEDFFGMFSRVSVWKFAPLFATAKGVRESPKKWSPVPNQLWRPQPSCRSCRDIQNCRVPRKKRDHKIAMFGAMNLKICIQRSHRSTEHQNACFSSFFWMPRIYQQKPGENPCLRTANEQRLEPHGADASMEWMMGGMMIGFPEGRFGALPKYLQVGYTDSNLHN